MTEEPHHSPLTAAFDLWVEWINRPARVACDHVHFSMAFLLLCQRRDHHVQRGGNAQAKRWCLTVLGAVYNAHACRHLAKLIAGSSIYPEPCDVTLTPRCCCWTSPAKGLVFDRYSGRLNSCSLSLTLVAPLSLRWQVFVVPSYRSLVT